VLVLFDEEMREHPPAEARTKFERVDPVVRAFGKYCMVLFSRLNESNARDIIARETEFFREIHREVEWKVYGHDRPANLGDLLKEAGYLPDPTETVMVLDLERPLATGDVPESVEIRRVEDEEGLRTASAVNREAFGEGKGWDIDEAWLRDPAVSLFVGYLDGKPVTSGRLEMPTGRSFASIWGGGTRPADRGRGMYRRLVVHRAQLARERGYRYLTVDALETSRPILEKMGFVPLDSSTGWVWKPDPAEAGRVTEPREDEGRS